MSELSYVADTSFRFANVVAFFSFAKGSLSIILDVLRAKKRQVRNTILFAMSCADLPASVSMALSTLPTPRGWGIYGAMGNMTSCRVQGFFVQLGVMALAAVQRGVVVLFLPISGERLVGREGSSD